jgi:hypothetical protein
MVGQTLLRRCLLTLAAFCVVVSGPALPAATPAATRPATQPAGTEVERLIRELGDRRYERREAAQRELAAMGEPALPHLLRYLRDPDPEIARRVAEALPIPSDPERRVELVTALLSTGDRDHLRRAVVILFQDPGAMEGPFRKAVAGQTGLTAVVAAPILEQLADWKAQDERYRENAAAHGERNPEGVARLSRMHAEAPAYLAEAAFWMALDARDEYAARTASTQPSPTTPPR